MAKNITTETEGDEEVVLEKNEEAIVDSVQAKLDALNGVESEVEDDGQAEETKPEDDPTPEEKQAEETDGDDDPTPEKEATDGDDNEQEVTLLDAYYRAAIHQDWTPDEIKEFFEATPELAVKTFAKLHESTNKLSSEFARIGRIKPDDGKNKSVVKTATEATEETNDDSHLAALKEQYGDDSAVVLMMTSMQTRLDAAEAEKRPTQEEVAEPSPQAKVAVKQFFSDPAMKPYADFYGTGEDADQFTQGQMKHRWEMLDMADVIIRGAAAQGLEMEADEAMDKAHMLVTNDMRESAIRTELKAKIVKRANGMTFKPASTKSVKTDDGPKTEKQLEDKVAAGLSKIYKR